MPGTTRLYLIDDHCVEAEATVVAVAAGALACDSGERKSIADQIGPPTKKLSELKQDSGVSEEELARLLQIIRPQFNLASVVFKGDLEKVFSEIHGRKDNVALRSAETV